MKKHKKFINILLIILLIISAINYDRIATKIIQKLPESTNRYLAELYKPDKLWLHRVDSLTYSPCLKSGDSWIQTVFAY